MAQAKGSKAQLSFQKETIFGRTPTTQATRLLYFVSESLGERINLMTSSVIRGNRNPTKPVRGNRAMSGSVKTELAPSIGQLLYGALGGYTAPGGGTPFTHTIKIGNLPSFSFEKGFTDLGLYFMFNGIKFNSLTIGPKGEGFQDVDIDVMGASEAQLLPYDAQSGAFTVGLVVTGAGGAKGTIIADTDLGVTGFLTLINVTGTFVNDEAITDTGTGAATVNGTLGGTTFDAPTDPAHTPWDGLSIGAIQEGGSDIAIVTAVDNIKIENNLDGSVYCLGGGGVRKELPEGKVKVSGSITAMFDSMALYNKALRFTESSLMLKWMHGTGVGSAGNESLQIDIPELVYSKETPIVDGDKGLLYKGPFEAYYDNHADASAIKCTLKNTEATIDFS